MPDKTGEETAANLVTKYLNTCLRQYIFSVFNPSLQKIFAVRKFSSVIFLFIDVLASIPMDSFSEKMDEKHTEAFLPSIKEHMVTTIPNDIQQLTIKDSTIFIGKGHPHHLKSSCFRRLNKVTVILVLTVIGIVLLPTLYHLKNVVSISGTADSGYYVSFNRDTLNSLTETVANVERMVASLPDAFSQNKFSPAASEQNVTILYSSRDPAASLYDYFQFKSVHVARNYRTTLSFFIINNQSSTYLDDISVNTTYGSQLIVNGGFDSGTYGWNGMSSYSSCYFSSSSAYSSCADSAKTLNGTIYQTFDTQPGSTLYISFKLRWYSYGSGIITKVTIYP